MHAARHAAPRGPASHAFSAWRSTVQGCTGACLGFTLLLDERAEGVAGNGLAFVVARGGHARRNKPVELKLEEFERSRRLHDVVVVQRLPPDRFHVRRSVHATSHRTSCTHTHPPFHTSPRSMHAPLAAMPGEPTQVLASAHAHDELARAERGSLWNPLGSFWRLPRWARAPGASCALSVERRRLLSGDAGARRPPGAGQTAPAPPASAPAASSSRSPLPRCRSSRAAPSASAVGGVLAGVRCAEAATTGVAPVDHSLGSLASEKCALVSTATALGASAAAAGLDVPRKYSCDSASFARHLHACATHSHAAAPAQAPQPCVATGLLRVRKALLRRNEGFWCVPLVP
jgi:hypothetical protein